jgi:ATPase subunit of ABC transporter with duplicated ATPase domains
VRQRERAQQAQAIEVERRQLQQQRREAQRNLEKHQKRNAMGRSLRRSGSQSTLLLDRQAERSERTAGRLRHLAERRLEQANDRVQTAQGRHHPGGRARLDLSGIAVRGGSRPILHCDSLQFRFRSERPLIEKFSLQLAAGERLVLSGPNGSGKSTLLRLIAGELEPQGGELQCKVPLARLDQHLSLLASQQDALENFRRLAPGLAPHDYYARLDAVGLPRGRLNLPARRLSGGERVRLALASLLLGAEPAHLLLLDEPTNHLDLIATEALEEALQGYRGALIVVSHDERFLAQLGIERTVELGY